MQGRFVKPSQTATLTIFMFLSWLFWQSWPMFTTQGKDFAPFLGCNFDNNLGNSWGSIRLGKKTQHMTDYWLFGIASTLRNKVWKSQESISEMSDSASSCRSLSATSWLYMVLAPSWGWRSCDLGSRSTKGSSLISSSAWPPSFSLAARRSRALLRGRRHRLRLMASAPSSLGLGVWGFGGGDDSSETEVAIAGSSSSATLPLQLPFPQGRTHPPVWQCWQQHLSWSAHPPLSRSAPTASPLGLWGSHFHQRCHPGHPAEKNSAGSWPVIGSHR